MTSLADSDQVSLSACADLQRAWEGPRGSLTAVLCEFLSKLTCFEFGLFCATETEPRLTEMIDRRKAAFAILPKSNVPCQVRHTLRLMADLAYPIAFTPFLVINSMRIAVPCIIIPYRRKRKR